MLNDYIMVGAAKVIDLGFDIDLILEQSVNQGSIITEVINKVTDYFDTNKIEMGQDLSLGDLRGQIMNQPGVVNIVDLRVHNKVGGQYSQSVTNQPFTNDLTNQIGLINDTVYAQPNEILQIRFPQKDISIRVQRPVKPVFA